MQLVLRALLVLSLVTLLHATRKSQAVKAKLGRATGQRGKIVNLFLDHSVQAQIASMSSPSIANMSLSPWTYRDSFETSRLPQRIWNASCLTSGCLSLQGGGEDLALEAKPIYYEVLVLHRVPQKKRKRKKKKKKAGNKYDFQLGMEVITVGCTCVRPTVVPLQ